MASLTVAMEAAFFRDLGVKFLFDGHDQFDSVKRVRTKVINERSFGDNLVGFDTELLNNDVFDLSFELGGHEESRALGTRGEGWGGSEGGSAGNKGERKDGLEHLDLC